MKLLDLLFGCTHKRLTFPRMVKRKVDRSDGKCSQSMYVVCLECGKEFGYDWTAMKIVPSDRVGRFAAIRVGTRAA